MTEVTYDSFPAHLRAVPGFERVYDEHLADYDEVLPHVLLGEYARFLSREAELCGAVAASVEEGMLLLEHAMGSRDPRVRELVAVSFLENLNPGDPSFPVIRSLFGPRLEEQYREYEEAADRET